MRRGAVIADEEGLAGLDLAPEVDDRFAAFDAIGRLEDETVQTFGGGVCHDNIEPASEMRSPTATAETTTKTMSQRQPRFAWSSSWSSS